MGHSHPVAFVDAWTDDLADEPLTALAATQQALEPWLARPGVVRTKWNSFLDKTGKVARIAAIGALKRSVDHAIGAGASAAIDGIINDASELTQEAVSDKVDEAATQVVDESVIALAAKPPGDLMRDKIDQFQAGQAAIDQMKASLSGVVSSLRASEISPPIIIIIDELDRCRPSYAIKLFEEIKHLFDVHGLVFVFGMNSEQLAHSVKAAYGASFDGTAYLRRFINRQYTLETPNLLPLVSAVTSDLPLHDGRLFIPPIKSESVWNNVGSEQAMVIARYMKAYDLPARAVFELADILQTCLFLTQPMRLHLAYLLPLIIGHLKGLPMGELPVPTEKFGFSYATSGFGESSGSQTLQDPQDLARRICDLANLPRDEFLSRYNKHPLPEYPEEAVMESISGIQQSLAAVTRYPRLVQRVGRFKGPQQLPNPNQESSQPKAQWLT